MKPAYFDFRTPVGGTPRMSVVLHGRDPRTKAVARLPLPGTTIEWLVEWPDGAAALDQTSGLLVDGRTGAFTYPMTDERVAAIEGAPGPIPYRVRVKLSDGSAYPFLTGTVGLGDPAPMRQTPIFAEDLSVAAFDPSSGIEPYLVGIILPYPLGAADQVAAAAIEMVSHLLAQPNVGAALATSPDLNDDSPRVATSAMVQAVKRQILAEVQQMIAAG
ncbi:hypothetical protein WYO_3712 [Methylobacterium sp. GXF4]|uniref:hypothetical protein n=1 Tax=Methylobacterium sp. GXF4 TaxID=1096546 RepID=UPI0002698030|nr:hypothetical protein [Methylobacterium sp. GXF4]EIZ83699.1 hypothetical protein WYO_3712 [Methylobacterium sp. GXF4]